MHTINKVAVLGGNGKTGNRLVTHLINQGYQLKLLLRRPFEFNLHHPKIEIVPGDATEDKAIRRLLEGCHAIISTIGQRKEEPMVASTATENILQSMKVFGIARYILLAGVNVDTPFDKKGVETKLATDWMQTNFPLIHADRQRAYSFLSVSDANWTLVRVPLIHFTDEEGCIEVSLVDCPGNKVYVRDIATFLSEQLSDTTYLKEAPFIASVDKA
jgi:putative NADH-flavin reductase